MSTNGEGRIEATGVHALMAAGRQKLSRSPGEPIFCLHDEDLLNTVIEGGVA